MLYNTLDIIKGIVRQVQGEGAKFCLTAYFQILEKHQFTKAKNITNMFLRHLFSENDL